MENHHFQWVNPRTKWAIFNSKLLVYQGVISFHGQKKGTPLTWPPVCSLTPVRRCRTGGLCIARADLDEATMALEVALIQYSRRIRSNLFGLLLSLSSHYHPIIIPLSSHDHPIIIYDWIIIVMGEKNGIIFAHYEIGCNLPKSLHCNVVGY